MNTKNNLSIFFFFFLQQSWFNSVSTAMNEYITPLEKTKYLSHLGRSRWAGGTSLGAQMAPKSLFLVVLNYGLKGVEKNCCVKIWSVCLTASKSTCSDGLLKLNDLQCIVFLIPVFPHVLISLTHWWLFLMMCI